MTTTTESMKGEYSFLTERKVKNKPINLRETLTKFKGNKLKTDFFQEILKKDNTKNYHYNIRLLNLNSSINKTRNFISHNRLKSKANSPKLNSKLNFIRNNFIKTKTLYKQKSTYKISSPKYFFNNDTNIATKYKSIGDSFNSSPTASTGYKSHFKTISSTMTSKNRKHKINEDFPTIIPLNSIDSYISKKKENNNNYCPSKFDSISCGTNNSINSRTICNSKFYRNYNKNLDILKFDSKITSALLRCSKGKFLREGRNEFIDNTRITKKNNILKHFKLDIINDINFKREQKEVFYEKIEIG